MKAGFAPWPAAQRLAAVPVGRRRRGRGAASARAARCHHRPDRVGALAAPIDKVGSDEPADEEEEEQGEERGEDDRAGQEAHVGGGDGGSGGHTTSMWRP